MYKVSKQCTSDQKQEKNFNRFKRSQGNSLYKIFRRAVISKYFKLLTKELIKENASKKHKILCEIQS